ncbi:YabP/YqfC family sporulation protein [Romboutsia sp. 1001713B170131_170501_G6]|uniref:YabP/YqfC family sporulation protein n=1 Tax=Romboutsia sp. 1001713B170131_170501_G6 TaxID=2787108 RepID=UPI0018AC022F|nr:YabP/YqfC family sporulation protein [Romboutsia sp. 1001713B170131_170501_G6]
MEHNITLKDRSNLIVSGVEHIYSFSDKKVEVKTSAGQMVIEGENLDMSKLSIDEKVINIDGTINAIIYSKERKTQESFFKKVFK